MGRHLQAPSLALCRSPCCRLHRLSHLPPALVSHTCLSHSPPAPVSRACLSHALASRTRLLSCTSLPPSSLAPAPCSYLACLLACPLACSLAGRVGLLSFCTPPVPSPVLPPVLSPVSRFDLLTFLLSCACSLARPLNKGACYVDVGTHI